MTTEKNPNKSEHRIAKAKEKLVKLALGNSSDKKILKQVEAIRDLVKKLKKKLKKAEKPETIETKEKAKPAEKKAKKATKSKPKKAASSKKESLPAGTLSKDLSYRKAVKALAIASTSEELNALIQGEKRGSVLKRAASRQRALEKV